MNLAEIRKKVDNVAKSTGTKHHKVLIADLCTIIKSLISVVEETNAGAHRTNTLSSIPHEVKRTPPLESRERS